MKYFFDTEFIEDGKTIDLISIGIVSEDGREYYAHSSEYDASKASDWVKDNVLPYVADKAPISREQIAKEIIEFVGEKPVFWAWYADYDWIALCQLYGTMMELPKGWPMYCRDVKQLCDDMGNPDLSQIKNNQAHDALADAHQCRNIFYYLKGPGRETERFELREGKFGYYFHDTLREIDMALVEVETMLNARLK